MEHHGAEYVNLGSQRDEPDGFRNDGLEPFPEAFGGTSTEHHRAEDFDPHTHQDEPDAFGDDGAESLEEHHGTEYLDPGAQQYEPHESVNGPMPQDTHGWYSNPTLSQAALPMFQSPFSSDSLQLPTNTSATIEAAQQQFLSAPPSLTAGQNSHISQSVKSASLVFSQDQNPAMNYSSENTGFEYLEELAPLGSPSNALPPDDFRFDSDPLDDNLGQLGPILDFPQSPSGYYDPILDELEFPENN